MESDLPVTPICWPTTRHPLQNAVWWAVFCLVALLSKYDNKVPVGLPVLLPDLDDFA